LKKILFLIFITLANSGFGQSFNDEKTSAINFVKRVFNSSPFEGVKKVEGDEANYYLVAVSYTNISKNSILREAVSPRTTFH
jgi:hypothetical protein